MQQTVYVAHQGRVEPTDFSPDDIVPAHEACVRLNIIRADLFKLAHMHVITVAYLGRDEHPTEIYVLKSDIEAIMAMRNVHIPIQPITDQNGYRLPLTLALIPKTALLAACYSGEKLKAVNEEIDQQDWFADDDGNIYIDRDQLSDPGLMEKCAEPSFVIPRKLTHIPIANHRYSLEEGWSFKLL